ncbi:MAG: hypothetical protein ACD_2C00086G0001 [uncultured bacterium (gcode 4)]|uniref:Uncharacterized protein n=1 Tax=uncultured bacterium (gcode 4) TaxID=1234023 RepID=K2H1Z2_9BACT|nr:MAG: hypothetical protein ACD_2C00086G0001 [uncultured bacterium (gcode 4)]
MRNPAAVMSVNYQEAEDEKMIVINRFLDNILNIEEKTWFSKHLECFKKIWHNHKYMRLWTWLALSAWAIWATAGWAFVLAAWLLAGRAVLSATWWYMATDAIFDIINKKVTKWSIDRLLQKIKETKDRALLESELQTIYQEIRTKTKEEVEEMIETAKKRDETKNNIKQFLSIWVGLTLWIIWWSRILTAAANPWIKEASSIVKSKVWNILSAQNAVPAKGVDSSLVKDIFKDIKHDHPSQNHITLEQAERRIVWLKQWIPLDHSEKLNALNDSVAHDIRKPTSGIIKSARELWFMKGNQTLDEAAKRLGDREIEKILIRAHENEIIAEWNWMTKITSAIAAPQMQNLATELPVDKSGFFKKATIWCLWILGLWFVGKKIYDLGKVQKWSGDNPIDSGIRILNPNPRQPRQRNSDETIIDAEIIENTWNDTLDTVASEGTSHYRTESGMLRNEELKIISESWNEIQVNKFRAIAKSLKEGFWFELDWYKDIDSNPIVIFSKETVWWSIILIYKQSWDDIKLEMIWNDHWIKKYTEYDSFNASSITGNQEELISSLNSCVENIYKYILFKRDVLKCKELARYLRLIEVEKTDLALIYKQLENPEVLRNWTETWWFWYQNIYDFNNWVLKMDNLQNPRLEEMDLTGWSFAIKHEIENATNWYIRKPSESRIKQFDKFEARLMSEMIISGFERNQSYILSWCSFPFNWHKHPWCLDRPSIWDLAHPDANAVVDFRKNPNLMTFTWGIVNHLPSNMNEDNKPENAIILRWSDFGWRNDYVIYFWRVNRNDRNSYRSNDLIGIKAKVVE